ncbi:hypothetical protein LPTSP2_39220 [Leptospira ellinghausenii]|uniref:Uncharacterized protein n=1 Tax=Leptospira ellinghausenii TaxID=1917822 RepID=A0A2P2DJ47_9LEPT|nr:hypothetical protein [Leptospira ellinghausenii]GBF44619.1 hypothetical protein LPTSP2_39220 [Leptospira ellinghausenii]
MNNRIVSINPYQLAAISALNDVANIPIFEEIRTPPVNVNSIIYSTLFQCGASHLNIHSILRKQDEPHIQSPKISLIDHPGEKKSNRIWSFRII